MGSLLAVALRTSLIRAGVARLSAGLFVVALIFTGVGARFGMLTMQRTLGAALQYSVVHIFFAGVLLLFLLLGTSPRRRFVNHATLRFFGYISYGLYLVHLMVFRIYDKLLRCYWPQWLPSDGHFALVFVRFLIAGGAAVGLAYLSRRYFEEAFLRLKERFTRDDVVDLAPDPATAPALTQLQDRG